MQRSWKETTTLTQFPKLRQGLEGARYRLPASPSLKPCQPDRQVQRSKADRQDATRRYMERDSIGNPIDSLFVLFNDPDIPSPSEDVLALFFAEKDWTTAQTWLNDPTSYGLTLDEADVLTVVKSVLEDPATAQATIESNSGDLSENVNGVGLTATSSRVLLMEFLDDQFDELIELPDPEKRLNNNRNANGSTTGIRLDAFPNPASESITISVVLNGVSAKAILNLYDAQGKQVMERRVEKKVSLFELDVSELPAGLYTLVCISEKGERSTVSLSILR